MADDTPAITFDEIAQIEAGDQFTDGNETVTVVEVERTGNVSMDTITYDNGLRQSGAALHSAVNSEAMWPVADTPADDEDTPEDGDPELVTDGGDDVTDLVDGSTATDAADTTARSTTKRS